MDKITPSHKCTLMKVSSLCLLVFVVGYVLGGLSVYDDWYPWRYVQTLRAALFGGTIMEPTPRNELFATFSPKSDVVMVGDSITSAGEWSEIFPNVKIANRGISGETAEDILLRMNTILSVRPNKAFVMVGINDIYDGQSVDQIYKNYVDIVEQLRAHHITVYIQSTIECSIQTCGNRLYKVRELNTRLKDYANERGIPYINLNAALSSAQQGLLPEYTYDGMHLKASGFVQWKHAIAPYID